MTTKRIEGSSGEQWGTCEYNREDMMGVRHQQQSWAMDGFNDAVTAAVEWESQGRTPRIRPRKIYIDVVKDDLKAWKFEAGER